MNNETGNIKFECHWKYTPPCDANIIEDINLWRNKLYALRLIGSYPNSIGYGNISKRLFNNNFIITGTATGNLRQLLSNHYTNVCGYSFANNYVICQGPIKASSESLTHAAIYESDNEVNAIIHIHSATLWQKWLNILPTSAHNIEYGTPQMANEIARLFSETNLVDKKALVMGGHPEGLIAFGSNINQAGKILTNLM
jgi:L-ribulose-5-phosphate 4-epimerase